VSAGYSGRSPKWWDRGNTIYDPVSDTSRPENPALELVRLSKALWHHSGAERQSLAEDALCLYFGNDRHSIRGHSSGSIDVNGMGLNAIEPPGYNVVQACVDTKTAHIVRNKVRPMFLTDAGDPDLQEKAKGMQRAVEAAFDQVGMYADEGAGICRDGNLFDAGCMKFCVDYANNRIIGERVFAHEILVPEREARLGKPRQMGHRMLVPRDSLINFFSGEGDEDAREACRLAPPASPDLLGPDMTEAGTVSDLIEAFEWWHLPSGRVDLKEKKSFGINEDGTFDPDLDPGHDGRHVICIDGIAGGLVLSDEPWPFAYFPIAFFKPQKNPDGFWSRGIPETLAGAQLAITRMNIRVDGIMNLHSVPRLIIDRRAKLNKSKLTNGWADILESSISPSQAVYCYNPNSVPAEFLNQIDKLIAWAEKQVGLSELSISAQKPAGIEHAPALQYLGDAESIRHTPSFRSWEQFHLDSARIMVDGLRMLAERNPDYEIIFGDAKDLQRIKWKNVDLGAEKYHLKIWATNLLPQTPGAKTSRIMDYVQSGLLTVGEGRALMEFPDIESVTGDANAEQLNIMHKLDAAIRGDMAAATPHAYLNLPLAMSLAKQRINKLEADGVKDDVWDRLIEFWEMCNKMNLQATNDAAQAAQGMLPPGAGGPPPGPGNAAPAPPGPNAAPAPMAA
jgi:hypothetical protein